MAAMRKALYILGQLGDADVEWLIATGDRRLLEIDEVLIRQGCPADALSIVLDGSLLVDVSGREVARLGVGEITGEMSFVDASPPSATVRAAQPSRVLCIPTARLAQHLTEDTAFAARFYRAIATLLSGRMRELYAQLGLAPADENGAASLGAEIDAGVLDSVHLAGARFDLILRRLAGG